MKLPSRISLYLLIFLFLFGLRAWMLDNVVLYDYDSTENYLVARSIAAGDFSNLFNHNSPLFNLFNGMSFLIFSGNYLRMEYLNICFNIAAVFIFGFFATQTLSLDSYSRVLLILLTGTSFFLVNSSRYFSIEASSLLLFVAIIIFHYRSLHSGKVSDFYKAALLYGILLTINIKSITLFPVLVLVEVIQNKRSMALRNVLMALLIIAAPAVFFMLAGPLLGAHWLRYSAKLYMAFFQVKSHPVVNKASFSFDVLFYIRYFIRFENPLLVLVLAAFPFFFRKELFSRFREMNFFQYIFLFAFCILGGMSILGKAPRGLLFAYPLFYLLLYLTANRLIYKKNLLGFFITFILIYNIYALQEYVYQYADTSYDKMGKKISAMGVKNLVTTIGIQVVPFLDEDIRWRSIFREQDIAPLRQEGFTHVLLDPYHRATDIHLFDALYEKEAVLVMPERSLMAPMIYLEHAEYSNMTFDRALEMWRMAREENPPLLRLIEIN